MHSYGLFWQLPASLEVNPGELAAPWASLLLPPGSQAFKHRLFMTFSRGTTWSSTKGSPVVNLALAPSQSFGPTMWYVACGNINLQVLM